MDRSARGRQEITSTGLHRLAEARSLIIGSRYEEAMRLYAEMCLQDPMNSALFREMLAARTHLINIKSTAEIMKLQHELNVLQGKARLDTLLRHEQYDDPRRLERFGHKVYSQNDEDGIIAEIFRRIGTTNRAFLEFGVEDGIECNTHLLIHAGWSGVWAEANRNYAQSIRSRFKLAIDTGHLKLVERLISQENINQTIQELELPLDLDLLSIDIDLNDYWVFKALQVARPRVVVIEYNGKFPPPMRRVVPYSADRQWDGTDYHGCSLQSLTDLAAAKGYQLVGCNITGANAFLVRTELCQDLFADPATAEHLYQQPRYELFRMGAFEMGHEGNFGLWLDL
jgi:hypothetical protein